jgi:hypothetical protein
VGDITATKIFPEVGSSNFGNHVRDKFGPEEIFVLGFSTFKGAVTASEEWRGPCGTRLVSPAREGKEEGEESVGGARRREEGGEGGGGEEEEQKGERAEKERVGE